MLSTARKLQKQYPDIKFRVLDVGVLVIQREIENDLWVVVCDHGKTFSECTSEDCYCEHRKVKRHCVICIMSRICEHGCKHHSCFACKWK